MKRKALAFVAIFACAAVILIGCGGGGGGGGGTSSTATSTGSTTSTTTGTTTSTTTGTTTSTTTGSTTGGSANQFAGRWDGNWTQGSPADNGTITLAISGNGSVSGDTFDANLNQEGTLSGIITSGGTMAFKVKYPSVTQTWSGTAAKDQNGHMVGTMNVSSNGTSTSFTYDLTAFGP